VSCVTHPVHMNIWHDMIMSASPRYVSMETYTIGLIKNLPGPLVFMA
jgi:hypothetical protein